MNKIGGKRTISFKRFYSPCSPIPPRKTLGLCHLGLESGQIWSFFFKYNTNPLDHSGNTARSRTFVCINSVVNDISLLPTE